MRATYSASTLGMHHILAPGLEVVLGQAPAHRLARQRFMLGQLDELARQQFQGPAGASRRRLRAGRRHQQRLFFARQLALGAGTRQLGERRSEADLHEATLGAVDRRAADHNAGADRLVARSVRRIWARLSLRAECLPPLSSAVSSSRSASPSSTRYLTFIRKASSITEGLG
jgi:hypothetical protein